MKIKKTVTRIQDKYNKNKIWIVKHDSWGHYYFNQEVCGKLHNKGFVRTTKKYINSVFDDWWKI